MIRGSIDHPIDPSDYLLKVDANNSLLGSTLSVDADSQLLASTIVEADIRRHRFDTN